MEKNVPTGWDAETGKNILWKVKVPGVGYASPIVWEDRIFTVSCLEKELERILLCWDRRTGKQLWQRTVLRAPLGEVRRVFDTVAQLCRPSFMYPTLIERSWAPMISLV